LGEKKKKPKDEVPDAAPTAMEATDWKGVATDWLADHANTNTKKAYETYQKQWLAWLRDNEVAQAEVAPEHVVCWMKELAERELAANTINKVALSAVADLYRYCEEKSPTRHAMVTAAKKAVGKIAGPAKQKKPLTRQMLMEMADVNLAAMHTNFAASKDNTLLARDVFMVLLLFTALLRESELVALKPDDVWEEKLLVGGKEVNTLFVYVEKSKTDQERRGHTIVVAQADDPRICPVGWFRVWSQLRSKTAPYLFHREKSDEQLARDTPNGRVKFMLEKIGVDSTDYGSHSGRSGGATAAAAAGIEVRLLKKQGGWKSDAVFGYIRESAAELAAVSMAILNAT
jgi:site-specific recombinase XerD